MRTRPAGSAAAPAGSNLIYFDYDSYVVKPEYANVIEAHARFLRADRNRKAAVEGHTDERGGREYNLALGQKRAEAVKQRLMLLRRDFMSASAILAEGEELAHRLFRDREDLRPHEGGRGLQLAVDLCGLLRHLLVARHAGVLVAHGRCVHTRRPSLVRPVRRGGGASGRTARRGRGQG